MSKSHRYGPPKSLHESFYDKSESEDEPASQPGSEEEIQDEPEGIRDDLPEASTSVRTQRGTSPTSQTLKRDEGNKNRNTEAGQRLEQTNTRQVIERPNKSNE